MMKPVRHFRAGRLPRVIVMAAAIGAISAAPALAASSHAYGIEARFAVSGVSTGIGPLAVVSGTAPPSYSKTQSAGKISEIVDIVPGPLPGVSLILAVPYADGLKSHVAGGFGVDTISAEGDVTIKSASLNLITGSLIPQANRADVTLLFLGISATNVKSSAHYELIAPGLVTIGVPQNSARLPLTAALSAARRSNSAATPPPIP